MNFPKTTATVETLGSGLDTILDPTPGSPVISAQIWVATGSMHESALAGAGVSHLLEHMVFKGTERFTGEELSQGVQAAGGQWNAYTTYDRTVYYIDGPADSLDLFLSALMEMVFRPAFPKDEYEKEKDVIRREIAMGQDDPDSVAHELNFRTLFTKDHRRQPIIGHRDLFDSITYEQMVTYHHARYRPDNAFVVISGGFEKKDAREIIERELEIGLRPFSLFSIAIPNEPAQLGPRRKSKPFAIPATHFSMNWQLPDLGHPDTPTLELLGVMLGGGRSAPLYRVIREELSLAHSIGSYAWITPESPGIFTINAEVEPENIVRLEKEILKQINLLKEHDLETELNRARRQLASQQFKILTTASGRASDLASNWHQTRNLDYTGDFLKQIEAVTKEDIDHVITTWLRPDRMNVVTLVPEHFIPKENITSQKDDLSSVTEHTLSNGLRIILQRDPSVPVVHGSLALLAGCLSETQENAGLNGLLASLLLKGTSSRNAIEIAESLEDLGASIHPGAGNNTLMLSSYCLRDDLNPVLDLLGEILREPTFPNQSVEREKAAIINRLKESLQDPASRAFRELRHQLWDGKGYGVPSSGSLNSLENLNRDQIRAHHATSFIAENLVFALFGDLDPEVTLTQLEATLGQIPSGKAHLSFELTPSHSREFALKLEKEQAVIAIGYPGLSATDPRRFALELLHSYCSDMAGPLFTRIREELGLAYFVSSSMFLGVNTGLLAFYLGTAPDQLEFATKELRKEIEKIANKGIPESRLASVKANTRAAQALSNQSPKSRASIAALDVLLGHSATHHLEQDQLMEAVSADDIRTIAAELLRDNLATIVTVSP